jgi:DNA invertase Pin-like site-specific DNA recombinase
MANKLPGGPQRPAKNHGLVLRARDRRRLERRAARIEAERRAQRDDVRRLAAAGASTRELAEAADVSHTTIQNWVKSPE